MFHSQGYYSSHHILLRVDSLKCQIDYFHFKDDSSNVENVLTTIVLDTDSFEWGGRKFTHNKVRELLIDLVSHYNGSSESEHCIFVSRYMLSNIFYKNKMAFKFDKFLTKLKSNFDTVEKDGEGRSEK